MNSCLDFLLTRFRTHSGADAIVWRAKTYNYRWLVERVHHWHDYLVHNDITPGTVITLKADYSPNAIALLLALIEARCVIEPTTEALPDKLAAEFTIEIDAHDEVVFSARTPARSARDEPLSPSDRPLIVTRSRGLPSELITHDVISLLQQVDCDAIATPNGKSPRCNSMAINPVVWTTSPNILPSSIHTLHSRMPLMMLLPFGALSGLKLLFTTLSQSGCVIALDDRSIDALQLTIQQHQIDVAHQTQWMQRCGQSDIPPTWLQLVDQLDHAIAA